MHSRGLEGLWWWARPDDDDTWTDTRRFRPIERETNHIRRRTTGGVFAISCDEPGSALRQAGRSFTDGLFPEILRRHASTVVRLGVTSKAVRLVYPMAAIGTKGRWRSEIPKPESRTLKLREL